MPKIPQAAQFQFVVKARVRKGTRPTRDQIRIVVEDWIEGKYYTNEALGWEVNCIIWDGEKKRTVTKIDESPRGQVLKSILQRGLPRATFRVNTMGRN